MTVLHDYHEGLGELIFRYEGTLDRFAGDAAQFDDLTVMTLVRDSPF